MLSSNKVILEAINLNSLRNREETILRIQPHSRYFCYFLKHILLYYNLIKRKDSGFLFASHSLLLSHILDVKTINIIYGINKFLFAVEDKNCDLRKSVMENMYFRLRHQPRPLFYPVNHSLCKSFLSSRLLFPEKAFYVHDTIIIST